MTVDNYNTLVERRNWMQARGNAKRSIGWEATYDDREFEALEAVLVYLDAETTFVEEKQNEGYEFDQHGRLEKGVK